MNVTRNTTSSQNNDLLCILSQTGIIVMLEVALILGSLLNIYFVYNSRGYSRRSSLEHDSERIIPANDTDKIEKCTDEYQIYTHDSTGDQYEKLNPESMLWCQTSPLNVAPERSGTQAGKHQRSWKQMLSYSYFPAQAVYTIIQKKKKKKIHPPKILNCSSKISQNVPSLANNIRCVKSPGVGLSTESFAPPVPIKNQLTSHPTFSGPPPSTCLETIHGNQQKRIRIKKKKKSPTVNNQNPNQAIK